VVGVVSGISIGKRQVGPGHACLVIAEAGVNHNGDLELARQLVDAAAEAGADVVKFQAFDPAALASVDAPKAAYQYGGDPAGTQREMLARLVLPPAAFHELKERAEARGLIFLCSPFDEGSADLLDRLEVLAFKVPSGEVTNHPFLRHLALKGRPLLISTGMCTLDEVRSALAVVAAAGHPPVALFHCVSSYPAQARDANLRAIRTLASEFDVPTGWSDHTLGIEVALAAIAIGADLLEKHLTLSRTLPGPDHRASLEPPEFARMVDAIRLVGLALGDGEKRPVDAELAVARVARKSLHWRTSPRPGTPLAAEHVVALRPGTGVSPARLSALLGRSIKLPVRPGDPLDEDDLEPKT
jgi:N,N'-diacetyllegionaminate synthase